MKPDRKKMVGNFITKCVILKKTMKISDNVHVLFIYVFMNELLHLAESDQINLTLLSLLRPRVVVCVIAALLPFPDLDVGL